MAMTTEGRRLWKAVHDELIFNAAENKVLLVAIEALARLRDAQKAVAEHGLLVQGPRGDLRANPALAVETSARTAFLSAMRLLNIDPSDTLSPHNRAAENAANWRQ